MGICICTFILFLQLSRKDDIRQVAATVFRQKIPVHCSTKSVSRSDKVHNSRCQKCNEHFFPDTPG